MENGAAGGSDARPSRENDTQLSFIWVSERKTPRFLAGSDRNKVAASREVLDVHAARRGR